MVGSVEVSLCKMVPNRANDSWQRQILSPSLSLSSQTLERDLNFREDAEKKAQRENKIDERERRLLLVPFHLEFHDLKPDLLGFHKNLYT